MGIDVHIPLRVVLPDNAHSSGGALEGSLAASLRGGLDQALGHAKREVFDPRGGYVTARPTSPDFVWRDPLGRIGQSQRDAVQAQITQAITDSLSAQSLTSEFEAPEVIPANPREVARGKQFVDGRYRVHSYDGDPPAADITFVEDDPVSAEPTTTAEWWEWDGRTNSLKPAIRWIMRTHYKDKKPARIGMICRANTRHGPGFYAIHVKLKYRGQQASVENYYFMYLLNVFRVVGPSGEETRQEPADGDYTHAIVSEFSGADNLRQLALQNLLNQSNLPLEAPESEPEVDRRRRQAATAMVEQFVTEHGGKSGHVMTALGTPLSNRYFLVAPKTYFMGETDWTLHGLWREVDIEDSGGDTEGSGQGRQGQGEGGGGEGSGGEGDGGDGAGDGGDGGGMIVGNPLVDPSEDSGQGQGSFFPVMDLGGEPVVLNLGPYEGEPSVDELGEAGKALARLIKRIAFRLEMPEGKYCGAFLIAAATMFRARASLVGEFSNVHVRATKMVEAGTGNLGDVELEAEHTPAVQVLRFIASVSPLITQLSHLMSQVYAVHAGLIKERYKNRHISWLLSFHKTHNPMMKQAVGHHYMRTCQVVMLQLLRASRIEIDKRVDNFDAYFPIFASLMTGFVSSEAKLRELRDTLTRVESMTGSSVQAVISDGYQTWKEARRSFSTTLSDQILNASEVVDGPDILVGQPIRQPDGSWAIRDDGGRLWTRQQLEEAIAVRSGAASSIDPLVHQLADIPDLVDTFEKRPLFAKAYLLVLLKEMQDNNDTVQADVRGNYSYAFRSGKIREDLPNRTVSGTSIAMQGIHLLAHEAVGDAFRGDTWYGIGLEFVFTVELGRLGLIMFAEISIVLAVSVICPPAGAALGGAIAGYHHHEAQERLRIYGALIEPELVYNRAELELDLFLAELEVALSIIPEIGSIARGTARGTSLIAKHGARRGAVRIGLQARRALMDSAAQQAKRGLARAFVTAVATDRVLAMLLPKVLGPVIEAVFAEISGQTIKTDDAPTTAKDAQTTNPVDAATLTPESDFPTDPDKQEVIYRLTYTPPTTAEEEDAD